MSLQLAAQHLSSQGRGNDSTLVHMSPREVKGLNDLAMAHGGQLSINPQTGLPEAGFLESILPMVAGAALTATGVGAPMAALMVGGGMTVMTGSLQKGLMAGLGAYGGANLGSGLLASGVDATPGVVEAQNLARTEQMALADKFYDPASGLRSGFAKADYLKQAQDLTKNQIDAMAGARTAAAPNFMGKLQAMGKGIGTLGQEGGFSNLYQNLGGSPMSLLQSVGSAAAPAIGGMMKPEKQEETKADSDMGQRYKFAMNPTGGQPQQVQPGQDPITAQPSPTTTPFPTPDLYGREQRYFAPSYSKLTPEEAKKLYGYAAGGEVQMQGRVTMDEQGSGQFGQTGFGQQGANGYRPAGNGFTGNNNSAPQNLQSPSTKPFGGLGQQGLFAGPAQREIQAAEIKRLGQGVDKIRPVRSSDQLVGQDDPFFQSPEYKEYRDTYPGFSTQDMYYSPIFGQMNSGSDGARQEAAYRKYKGIAEPEIDRGFKNQQGGLGSPQGSFGGGLQGGLGGLQGGLGGLFGSMQQGFGSMLSPQTRGSNFVQQEPSSYADGGVATDPDRPTETPALLAFKQMQAQRAAQPPAPQIDANAEFAKYAQQTVGAPNQMQAPTMPAPTSTSLADSGYAFNPIKQQYSQITGTAPAELAASDDPLSPVNLANNFSANNPGVPHSRIDPKTGAMVMYDRYGNVMNKYASGGVSHLGDYSDGGRLLRGPGDGVSDSIPAMIGKKQPARLADGEFVVPARIVSELGNGSTEAGARKLYAMMDRIQKARGKTVGKNKVAKNSRSEKYLPA